MDALRATILHAMQHTSNVFLGEDGKAPRPFKPSESAKIACKIHDEYAKATAHVPAAKQARRSQGGGGSDGAAAVAAAAGVTAAGGGGGDGGGGAVADIIDDVAAASAARQGRGETAVVAYKRREEEKAALPAAQSKALALRKRSTMVDEPEWHAPWKLMRVISGHNGWVRAITVDPTNEWFATGGNDRMIKIWDLASGQLKLTLTGHISSVRGLACSARHPYLFSVSEDKMVKCWDLETNKVVRHYHGHLSGVYCVALHPTIDVLVTGGRDSVARVWDMRTRHPVHVLTGHKNTVMSVATQAAEPQIITGSMDCFVKLWDLKAGKCHTTLTNHKKSIRALAIHPEEYTFMSGGGDNIKKWACPDGDFMKNFAGHNTIVHSMALNHDNVLMSGGDNGSLYFWDYKTGYNFQRLQTRVQPGSMDSEAAIFAATFDKSGSRLITCEADKTIKVWREDADATPDTHPVDMHAWTQLCRKRKRF